MREIPDRQMLLVETEIRLSQILIFSKLITLKLKFLTIIEAPLVVIQIIENAVDISGNILDHNQEHVQASKRSDFSMVKSKFEQVIQTQYPGAMGHIAFKLVPCPQICTESLSILSR